MSLKSRHRTSDPRLRESEDLLSQILSDIRENEQARLRAQADAADAQAVIREIRELQAGRPPTEDEVRRRDIVLEIIIRCRDLERLYADAAIKFEDQRVRAVQIVTRMRDVISQAPSCAPEMSSAAESTAARPAGPGD